MGMACCSPYLLSALVFFSLLQRPIFADKKSYVVYFGGHSHHADVSSVDYERVTDSHYKFLGSFLGSQDQAKEAIFYSYQKYINGFAANLEEEEAAEVAKHPDVISIFLNKGRKLHTTRSWDFLGMERNGAIPSKSIWRKARFGEDTIIGNLDTGVWPESESFGDEEMGPIPPKWKGICQIQTKQRASCNRKLIGARYFSNGYAAVAGPLNATSNSARDVDGHGTHTLSTAGGAFVGGANIFGYANGTAKGGSPRARVATYKVCWPPFNGSECFDADMLAGFDAAIHDGVDVLSVSLGGPPIDYFSDGLAIGSFHAVQNGVVVVCSAGNSGPTSGSVSNLAPWILTVGASTMDREFPSYIELGNNDKYKGQSLSSTFLKEKMYCLISSVDAKAMNASRRDAKLCLLGSLDPKKVRGKIVFCVRGVNARVEKGEAVREAGGAGMILANDEASGNEIIADAHVLPASHINVADGLAILSYINSTRSPTAYITHPKSVLGSKPAPYMAAFSSQGPNGITPEILKPDITAPGVSVLAAYSQASSPTGLSFDTRRVPFGVESGTSMSCPHVSGIAGLLRTLHPSWSPSAIRSAIMTSYMVSFDPIQFHSEEKPYRDRIDSYQRKIGLTEAVQTSIGQLNGIPLAIGVMDFQFMGGSMGSLGSVVARQMDNMKAPIKNSSFLKATPFSYGAGHVHPNRAMDPGLVYDLTTDDYLNFLCSLGYNSTVILTFSDRTYSCPTKKMSLLDFNYPSITVPNLNVSTTVTRRLKNVGPPGTYTVRVAAPSGVSAMVEPQSLKFDKMGEEKMFKLTVVPKKGGYSRGYVFGRLIWSDGLHFVRSPIVVFLGSGLETISS